ncbi:divergent polysaccharide deacetylase family protein [Shewanella intestini]|uniref:divergent polysaccharide deacetylase family protein n=1 Tax=Shewanella TaxID=22 RepID=UPI003618201D
MRLFFITLVFLCSTQTSSAANIAIIIDDIGYRQTDKAVLNLDTNITLSVLPHTPLGRTLANQGFHNGHEIMLHIPMQAIDGSKLGPGGLTNQMNENEVKQVINRAVENIPYAKGANNHMGSLFTQLSTPMKWVMQSLKQKDLYFVDSVTTKYSKAAEQAQREGVPITFRHIFLDNETNTEALERQFSQAIEQAKTDGRVVLIGHPYPETVEYLKNNVKRLRANGIALIKTSTLIALSQKIPTPVIAVKQPLTLE